MYFVVHVFQKEPQDVSYSYNTYSLYESVSFEAPRVFCMTFSQTWACIQHEESQDSTFKQ